MKNRHDLLSRLNLIKKMMNAKVREKDVVYIQLNIVNENITVLNNKFNSISLEVKKAMEKLPEQELRVDIIATTIDYIELKETKLTNIRGELEKLNDKKENTKKELVILDNKLSHLGDSKKLTIRELELLLDKEMDAVALMSWLHKRNEYA